MPTPRPPLVVFFALVVATAARSQLTDTQEGKLLPDNPSAHALFGASAAVDGDTAIVGAYLANSTIGGTSSGAAYVFVRSGSTWSLQARLEGSLSTTNAGVGNSVAISGDTAVVGSYGYNGNQGAAYVFVRSGTTWSQQAVLTAADGAANDFFGNGVSIAGNTIAVGAPEHGTLAGSGAGAVYVYVRSGTVWNPQAELTAADAAAFDELGKSVALSGDTLVAGAESDDNAHGVDAGAGYVFVRSGTTWAQQAKLMDSTGAANNILGFSSAVAGDTAVLGSYAETVSGKVLAGSVSVFTRSGTVWSQQAKLTAADVSASAEFGTSVALSGDALAVGAVLDSNTNGANAGAAYLFVRGAGVWSQKLKLLASDGSAGDNLGSGVGLGNDGLVAGAESDANGLLAGAGSAYAFRLVGDWDDLGFGLAGISGQPLLAGVGPLIGGSAGTLTLSNARPSSACVLFVSLALTPTPFKGGTLAALPAVLLVPLVTSGAGTLPLPFTWPSGIPAATAFHFQYAISDPAAVKGVALSHLLRGTTP